MKEKLKYFILNTDNDFSRCICENMVIHDNSLVFSSDGESGFGRFMTRIFDSGDRGTVWHRLIINAKNCDNEDFRITLYSSDTNEIKYGGRTLTADELYHDDKLTLDQKAEAFEPFLRKRLSGVTEAILHDITGRYIWALTEIYSDRAEPAVIESLRILLPAQSWIEYLPQIYRSSDSETHFLERYLGIFQTYYEDLEDEISNISQRFDPESAESEYLTWLAGWLGISGSEVWSEEKLRKLLLKAFDLYRKRGTKESLSEIIELYTGEKPFIIEGSELREFAGTEAYEKTLMQMYGNDPYKVTVLIKSEHIKSDQDLKAIRRISAQMLPAYAELDLVVLEPYIFLDRYSYLGINSTLGKYRPALLDGKTRLNMSTIGNTP